MVIQYTAKFKKQYKKLPQKFQLQFDQALMLFIANPTNPKLRNHPLVGKYKGYWSININGDLRAIYVIKNDELIIFALIETHSQLYG